VDVLRTGEFHVTQVDRVQVLELFCNLVADAYDAMPHGGSLLLEASAEGGEVVVSVEDTGAGFDPGCSSGPTSFRPKLRGSGLGLAVAQQIADAHGGGLTLAETRGGGTVVTVRLPGAAPTDDAADRGTAEQPGHR
jgi:signal transduction histidine kinase